VATDFLPGNPLPGAPFARDDREGGSYQASQTLTRHGRPCAGHPRLWRRKQGVDGRDEPGHDVERGSIITKAGIDSSRPKQALPDWRRLLAPVRLRICPISGRGAMTMKLPRLTFLHLAAGPAELPALSR